MTKLKLDLDTLHVQSFGTTAAPAAARGTVHGAEFSLDPFCADPNDPGSLLYSCKGTCNCASHDDCP
ncbi:MAG TPA: hypothetical protein VFX98_04315 [Longimicrobiaceae bacterium]|nr:hypothetical protein [Longimicrobiaceae bacterium]